MSATPVRDFAGFVLAGGSSRRMGRDKALVEVDGRPLVLHACTTLRAAGASRVTVVGGDAAAFHGLGLATLADEHRGEGPLGAIVTALGTRVDGGVAAVLSCDLVDPSPANVTALLAQIGPGIDVVVASRRGRPQWLHAAWSVDALGELKRIFAQGERSIGRAAQGLMVEVVEVPDPDRLQDADTPADLSSILREREDRR
jgi:molybdopterin-guanine dinucleotide biosynthesis protein A